MIATIVLTFFATSLPWALLCWRLRGQRNVAAALCSHQAAVATELAVQVELWRHRARLAPKVAALREACRRAAIVPESKYANVGPTVGDLEDRERQRAQTSAERLVEQRFASPGPVGIAVGLSPVEVALVYGSQVESPPADNGSGFSGGGGESGGGGSSDTY